MSDNLKMDKYVYLVIVFIGFFRNFGIMSNVSFVIVSFFKDMGVCYFIDGVKKVLFVMLFL